MGFTVHKPGYTNPWDMMIHVLIQTIDQYKGLKKKIKSLLCNAVS